MHMICFVFQCAIIIDCLQFDVIMTQQNNEHGKQNIFLTLKLPHYDLHFNQFTRWQGRFVDHVHHFAKDVSSCFSTLLRQYDALKTIRNGAF